jgi:hypothetical protein
MSSRSSSVVFTGVTASAAIPEIQLYNPTGKSTVTAQSYLAVDVKLPSASTYDWSSLPPLNATKDSVTWITPLVSHNTPGRVAVGIDYSRQASDSNATFIAGALLGLAGAAFLSAVQEALRAFD